MTKTNNNGRLGNQIIRNLAVSMIAEKNNLFVEYYNYDLIDKLGIKLFIGTNNYDNIIDLTDNNYFDILELFELKSNLNANNHYLQTKEITNMLYQHLHKDDIKNNIINKNPNKDRYNNNNDLFIHIRLTDVAHFNPGIQYYLKAIYNIQFENIYLATDDFNHIIIKELVDKYPNIILFNEDEITTIQFASTCKNIILSHGSFSAIIGYLAFYSTIYFPEYDYTKLWYGDMFSIPGWNKI
jgi:hypothetical protein